MNKKLEMKIRKLGPIPRYILQKMLEEKRPLSAKYFIGRKVKIIDGMYIEDDE